MEVNFTVHLGTNSSTICLSITQLDSKLDNIQPTGKLFHQDYMLKNW